MRYILLVIAILVGILVWSHYFNAPGPGPNRDPSRYVKREPDTIDKFAGKHAVTVMERAKRNTDLLNNKQAYAYHVTDYHLQHGSMPQSLDDLVRNGMNPQFLKDTAGLDVHYELVDMHGQQKAKIYTYGPDHTGGTEDDVIIYVP